MLSFSEMVAVYVVKLLYSGSFTWVLWIFGLDTPTKLIILASLGKISV